MKHIVYISRAVHALTDEDLQHLLDQSRRDNAQHGITGILFYSHGNIAQLFEGDATTADTLYERISRDGRHSDVRKLIDRPIAARSFSEWSMAFHPLAAESFQALQGFLLPHQVPPAPATLPVADALLVELVRLAVFGPDPSQPYHHTVASSL
ncbi:BLUF domain-containing protein [Hymenobacter swuensis]|uniref:BLUF domain-containing protein n=1 Tax=Hymenobacter swuensis DY53 TaxID=1227739 RepID=W8EWR1_9BACT|nr:BLUF domain-containing protein [Hymenobacter swuensis]AHJ97504.1 hypothetical protein Hsw_1909 [Hymenobacter swuensis DY53]